MLQEDIRSFGTLDSTNVHNQQHKEEKNALSQQPTHSGLKANQREKSLLVEELFDWDSQKYHVQSLNFNPTSSLD